MRSNSRGALCVYISTFVTYGAVYAFTLLYPLIKRQENFSQKDIDFAGTAFYAGSNLLGWFLASPMANSMPIPIAIAITGMLQPACQMLIGLTAIGAIFPAWYLFALFYLVLGFSSGVVFNLVTQKIINILPSAQSLAVAIPSCSHAFGGLIFSILIAIIPLRCFFIILVLLQVVFTSLTVYFSSQKESEESTPLLESSQITDEREFTTSQVFHQLLRSSNFYLCILPAGIMIGCGTSLMTNVGVMAQSLNLKVEQGAIVTQFAQFCGRASISVLYYAYNWPTDTIDIGIILSSFYAIIFFFVALSDSISDVGFTMFNVIFGALYGSGWTIVGNFTRYTVRPEKQYWTDTCAVIYPSTAVGTFLFNYIIASNYDNYVLTGEVGCFGMKCYRTAFYMIGTCAMVSVACLVILRQKTLQTLKAT